MSSTAFVIVLLTSSVVMTLAMLVAWTQFGRERHLLLWALAYAAAAVQWVLNGVGLQLSSAWLLWLSSVATIVSLALSVSAVRVRAQRTRAFQPVVGVTAMLVILSALVAWKFGLALLLAGFVPACALVGFVVIAGTLQPSGRPMRAPERTFQLTQLAFAAFEVALLVMGARAATSGEAESIASYRSLLGWGLPIFYVISGMAAIFVVASDHIDTLIALVSTDSLTDLLNRRGFELAGGKCLAQSRRLGLPVTVVVCDLDGLKQLNDEHGHDVGDKALRLFALTLAGELRAGDVVGRIGGDEFVVVLGDTSAADGERTIERVREALSAVKIPGAPAVSLRSSFGVAEAKIGDDLPTLVRRADLALYDAKRGGKNQVARRTK